MTKAQLIKLLETTPDDHEIIISARGLSLEISKVTRMAYTTFIVCDKAPVDKEMDNDAE